MGVLSDWAWARSKRNAKIISHSVPCESHAAVRCAALLRHTVTPLHHHTITHDLHPTNIRCPSYRILRTSMTPEVQKFHARSAELVDTVCM
eukprot:scaffold1088_cov247-Pinguiococcus_pyrenoidosus.AAC.24